MLSESCEMNSQSLSNLPGSDRSKGEAAARLRIFAFGQGTPTGKSVSSCILRQKNQYFPWGTLHLLTCSTGGTQAMLTSRYMTSTKNLAAIMKKIVDGTAPPRFTVAHLRGLGFKSSNDQGIIPVLKDLKFLNPDGTPAQRYHDYRDPSKSKAVMAEALREAYGDLFHITERPTDADRAAIKGKFKSTHNVSDQIANLQTTTFYSLLKLADLDAAKPIPTILEKANKASQQDDKVPGQPAAIGWPSLRYNIEVHLPATKDIDVYNAIFKSLREHLIV